MKKIVFYGIGVLFIAVPEYLHAPFLTIDRSHEIAISGDIIYTPTFSGDSVIVVSTSNVTLDLGGNTIIQNGLTPNINGIVISPGLSNITIRYGVVSNITGTGLIINEGCFKVVVDSVQTLSCDLGGISMLGASNNKITSVDINNCDVLRCCQTLGGFPFFVKQSSGFRVSDCRVSNNGTTAFPISAVRLENCSNARFDDIRANSNIGSTKVIGFDLDNVADCFFLTCVTRNNNPSSTSGYGAGFDFQLSCTDNFLVNCFSFASAATQASSTFNGFRFGPGCDDNTVSNCKATQNRADSTCFGFTSVSNTGNAFLDCISQHNTSVSASAVGFNFNTCIGNICLRCMADGQASTNSTALGIDITSCNDCFFQENFFTRNAGSSSTNSFGLRTSGGTNGFIKNVALRNGTTTANQFSGLGTTQKEDQPITNTDGVGQPWTNVSFI